MSFPAHLQQTFTAKEINFIAENEFVEIVSNASMDSIPLISTNLPKLRPLNTYKVPIWLAVLLRKQNKVTVTTPSWLNVKYLTNKYEEEVEQSEKFSELPDHWIEICKMFIKNFKDDLIDDPVRIQNCVQELREIRLLKLRKGLRNLNDVNLGLNDLSLMEINEFRPFISEVMNGLSRFSGSLEKMDEFDEPDYENDKLPSQPMEKPSNDLDAAESDEDMDGVVEEFEL